MLLMCIGLYKYMYIYKGADHCANARSLSLYQARRKQLQIGGWGGGIGGH